MTLFSRFTVLLLLLVAGVSSPVAAQTLPPVSERDRYGVNDDYMVPIDPASLAAARQAGFSWVNYTLYWNIVNPAPSTYDWSWPDTEIQRIVDAGLVPYVRIRYAPTWATNDSYPTDQVPFFCPANPAHPDCACKAVAAGVQGAVCNDPANNWRTHIPSASDFATFVTAAVNRYKDRVRFWGVGDESHNPYLWAGTIDDFVSHILRPGYDAIKAIDPSLTVVGPDEDSAEQMNGLLLREQASGRFFDVISFHLLRETCGNVHLLDDPSWPLPSNRCRREVFLLKPTLDTYGKGRPLWLTELGAISSSPADPTDAARAAWFTDQFAAVLARPWIDKVFVYRLSQVNPAQEDYGVLASDGTPKAAFTSIHAFLATQSTPQLSYLAEGALGIFEMDVCLANPNLTEAPVKLTFLKDDGTIVVLPKVLASLSRDTVHVNDVPGVTGSLSTVVESTTGVPVVVERTMMWGNRQGGHTGSAVDGAKTRWYFAEGAQGVFDTFVLLANDNIVSANVTVTFLREGLPPVPYSRTVPPKSRRTIYANDIPELVNQAFSIQVDSDQPVIAERAMYFGGPLGSWKGGHESAGVGALSEVWYHAEGATGPEFDTWLLVGNPNDVAADLKITFYRDSGGPIEKFKTVGAKQRYTENIEWLDPVNLGSNTFSIKVESLNGVPVVSERAMYWPGTFAEWEEAHNSLGVTEPATRWALAEGRIGMANQFETYILIANPNATSATVKATFLRKSGPPLTQTYTVRASSRFTIGATFQPWFNVPSELKDEEFGTIIESVGPNAEPLVVEQAIYWSATRNGQLITRAGGANVVATKLP